MIRRLMALAGLPGLVLGAVALASPAGASASHPAAARQAGYAVIQVNQTTFTQPVEKTLSKAPLIGAWKICTRSGTQRCLLGRGIGLQFELEASGYATFTRIGAMQGFIYETQGNENCPQAKDGAHDWTVIEENGCDVTNNSYEWNVTGDSPNRLQSVLYGRYLATILNQNGAKTTTQPGSGAFYLGQFGT